MTVKSTIDELPHATEAIRAYYDDFTESHLPRYERESNLRIEKALERLLPYVAPQSGVLEIGCGIGLVAQRIAALARQGSVWGCDISEKSVRAARRRVADSHVHFRAIDIVGQFDDVREWIAVPLNLVVMIDVLEHIPSGGHRELFKNLRSILVNDGKLVLTFPSPHYQRHLHRTNPQELQIIDETIELEYLALARETGFEITNYSLEDVWLTCQYVHCVLSASVNLTRIEEHRQRLAIRDLEAFLPAEETFVLVDQAEWSRAEIAGRRTRPFLEKNGEYWGPPADDAAAINECARICQEGIRYFVFASPAFWWLDYYAQFRAYLDANFRRLLDNDRVVVFQIRSSGGDS